MTIVPYVAQTVAPYALDLVREGGTYLYNKYGNDILAARRREQHEWLGQMMTRPTPSPYLVRPKVSTLVKHSQYHNPKMLTRYTKRPYKRKISPSRSTVLVRQPKAELKGYYNSNVLATSAATTGTPTLITNIAAGTGVGDRDGTVVKLMDLSWTGALTKNSGNDPYIIHRIIVFQWNQGYTSPAATSVLNTNDILSTYNQQDARNYRILSDKYYKLTSNAGVAAAYAADDTHYKGYARLNTQVTYSGTSGTSHDRSVWVMAISTSVNGAVNFNAQVRFIDV